MFLASSFRPFARHLELRRFLGGTSHAHTRTSAHALARSCAHAHMRTRAHAHSRARAHASAHARACAHTRTRVHARAKERIGMRLLDTEIDECFSSRPSSIQSAATGEEYDAPLPVKTTPDPLLKYFAFAAAFILSAAALLLRLLCLCRLLLLAALCCLLVLDDLNKPALCVSAHRT